MEGIIQAVVLVLAVATCSAWEQDDMEIYDLYEEVNGTFYEFLGISESASTSEVRKSYRKLSLSLHPDKNKAENAEEQFRQLVAIYEILKDTEKRKKYDDVLKNGLPDWRQPIYYYRKYRKMGTLELSIIISIIFTVGHYLTWWVAYLEKKFEMDEVLDPLRKRLQKKKAKGKATTEEEIDTEKMLEKELGYRKPGRWDLLPFVLYRCFIRFIKHIVNSAKEKYREYEEKKEMEALEAEEESAVEDIVEVRPKRVKPKVVLRDASEFADESNAFVPGIQPADTENDDEEIQNQKKNSEWSDEDYAALAKSMGKFPGGTPGRWERIAHELGQSPAEVIKTVKNLKSSYTSNTATGGGDKLSLKSKREANITELTKAMDTELKSTFVITDSVDYSNQEDVPDDYDEGSAPPDEPDFDYTVVNKKSKVKTRPVEETKPDEEDTETNSSPPEEDIWSQVQQKCLEAAIKQFPKSTTDRWTCISRAVPEKNKEQCVARFKILAELMKQRKKETKT